LVCSFRRFEGTVFLGTPGDTQPHSLTLQNQLISGYRRALLESITFY